MQNEITNSRFIPQGFSKTLEKRFWSRITKTYNCWEWEAKSNHKGYGLIYVSGKYKQMSAHRVSWIIHFGDIQPGLMVLHKCDNPKCVNPNHLMLGTALDNTRDMLSKGRNWSGIRTLSPSDVIKIRSLIGCGLTQKDIAKIFNVSQTQISRIQSNKRWKSFPKKSLLLDMAQYPPGIPSEAACA